MNDVSVIRVSRCGITRGTFYVKHVLTLIWVIMTDSSFKIVSNWVVLTQAIFCVATVGTHAYMVHKFFSLDVPRWEALAWSAAQAPMYRVPAFVVPMLRKDIISIYTTGTPAANKQMMKLPVSEDV